MGSGAINNLPPGFELDAPVVSAKSMLPQGFEIDQSPQEMGFFDTLGQNYDKRLGMAQQAANAGIEGKQTMLETYTQMALNGGGGLISDELGDVLSRIFKNDTFKPSVKNAASSVVNPIIAPVAKFAQEQYSQLSPRTQRNVDAAGNALNLATTFLPSGAAIKAADIGGDIASAGLKGAGESLIGSANKAVEAKRIEGISKGILPDTSTVAGREEAIQNGGVEVKKGIFGKDIIPKPDKFQQEAIQEVSKVPGVNPKNLHVENASAIDNAIEKEAEALKKTLKENDIDLSITDPQFPNKMGNKFSGILDNIVSQISEHETIKGNANKVASNLANKMHGFVSSNPQTLSGLLEARKQFDSFVKKEIGKFPEDAGAMGSANKQVRDAVNNYIEQMNPTAEVKKSLARQSALFRGRDAYETKGRKQPFGKAERAVESINNANKLKGLALKIAPYALGGGAAALVPSVGLPAAALYGAYKGVTAPITRKALGKTLKAAGSIKPTIEDALKASKKGKK